MLRLLELYIDLTYDIDWTAGNEPIVCRPLVEIAEHLDRTERQIRNIERALLERGLLAFRDSGNHHRKGQRDRRTGRLLYGYGPSLAPLGQRAAEIIAMAAEARSALAAGRRCRIAIAALRRRLRAGIAAAAERAIPVDDIATAIEAVPACRAGMASETLECLRQRLGSLTAVLERRLEADYFHSKTSATEEISLITTKGTPPKKVINDSSIPLEKAKAPPPQHRANSPAMAASRTRAGIPHIPIALALTAAGEAFRSTLSRTGEPGWRGLVAAAAERAGLCDIDQDCWAEACHSLGRDGAALCLLILDRRLHEDADIEPIRSPRAYFRAMIERARDGTLHIDRSIRALSRRGVQATVPVS